MKDYLMIFFPQIRSLLDFSSQWQLTVLEWESGIWGLSFGSIPVWSPAEDLPLWGSSFLPCRMKRLTLECLSQLKFYSPSPSSRYEANTDGSIVCKREFSHQSCQEGTPGDPGSPPSALVRSQTIARKQPSEAKAGRRQVSPWVCGMRMCVCGGGVLSPALGCTYTYVYVCLPPEAQGNKSYFPLLGNTFP